MKGDEEGSPSAPLADDSEIEIPAALVGQHFKENLIGLAPLLGRTPVALLRSALVAGLTGGAPLFTRQDLARLRAALETIEDDPPASGELGPVSEPGSGPRAS